jgi:hypothetical protein
LHDFRKLKKGEYSNGAIARGRKPPTEQALWEYLPDTLEELTVWAEDGFGTENRLDYPDLAIQVIGFVRRKETRCPGLRKISIDRKGWLGP